MLYSNILLGVGFLLVGLSFVCFAFLDRDSLRHNFNPGFGIGFWGIALLVSVASGVTGMSESFQFLIPRGEDMYSPYCLPDVLLYLSLGFTTISAKFIEPNYSGFPSDGTLASVTAFGLIAILIPGILKLTSYLTGNVIFTGGAGVILLLTSSLLGIAAVAFAIIYWIVH